MVEDLLLRLRGVVDSAARALPTLLARIATDVGLATAALALMERGLGLMSLRAAEAAAPVLSLARNLIRFQVAVRVARTVGMLTAAVTALAGALLAATGAAAEWIVEQRRLAEGLGLPLRTVQELSFAVQAYGGDLGDAADALGTLTDRARDAQDGMQSFIDDFALIGIRVDDLRGKDPAELFRLFAERASQASDANAVTAATLRIFGDDLGRRLLPMLRRGTGEMDRLADSAARMGLIVGDDAAAAAEAYSFELGELRSQLRGVSTAMSLEMIPATTQLRRILSGLIEAAAPAAIWAVSAAADGLVAALSLLTGPLRNVVHLMALGTAGGALIRSFVALRAILAPMARVILPYLARGLATVARSLVATAAPAIALGLALDDLIVYLRGGESALGRILPPFREVSDAVSDFARRVSESQAFADLLTILQAIGTALSAIVGFVAGVFVQRIEAAIRTVTPLVEGMLRLLAPLLRVGALAVDAALTPASGPRRAAGESTGMARVGDAFRSGLAAGRRDAPSVTQQIGITVQGVTGEQVGHQIRRALTAEAASALSYAPR